MVIKHIVIAGGGPAGFITYGVLKHLSQEKFWSINNIESLYGTSIGAFFSTVVCLDYKWNILDDYFIERPWDKLIEITPQSIINVFISSGAVDPNIFAERALEPLLTAKGLDKDTTLKDFYDFCGIDLHIFATEINSQKLQKVDLSHTTHPDWKLTESVAMSIAYPLFFKPICKEDKCYIDGGLINHYPIKDCIEQKKCKKEEILGIKNIWLSEKSASIVQKNSSITEFISVLLKKMRDEIDPREDVSQVKNTVRCTCENISGFDKWLNVLSNKDMRTNLISSGINQAKLFLQYIKSSD